MASSCKKCSLPIGIDELFTVCEGKCAKSFHASCVGVSEADVCALSKNIIWICDTCMVLFYRARERTNADAATNTAPSRSLEDEIDELKCTVSEIVNALENVLQKPNTAAPYLHSTPTSSPKLLDGTCEDFPSGSTRNESLQFAPRTSERPPPTFALYLTNIDRHVSENDISVMISRSLNAPLSCCYDVVKLIPKNKIAHALDFISFKAVLNEDLKPLAMNPATWPKGIKYREFVSRFNETWKPST